MSIQTEAIKAAIHTAIVRSIRKMGVENFKKTSFFGSSHVKAAEQPQDQRDAA